MSTKTGHPIHPRLSQPTIQRSACANGASLRRSFCEQSRATLACEHTFVTSRGHPHAEFQRALKNGSVWVAEAVARELHQVSLEDALKLVHLYAAKKSPKFDRAAMKWLRRYFDEKSPTLKVFAEIVASLAQPTE